MNQKTLAREWLLFLGCLAIGLTVAPFVAAAAFGAYQGLGLSDLPQFWGALYSEYGNTHEERVGAWVATMSPYVLVQFIRSVTWAVRTATK